MNKKRDALRRGIRELIADTTRDLAAFEGRELERRPPAPRPQADGAVPGHAGEAAAAGAHPHGAETPPETAGRDGGLGRPDVELRPPVTETPREIPRLNGAPPAAGGTGETAASVAETIPERTVPPVVPFEFITESDLFSPATPAEGEARSPRSASGRLDTKGPKPRRARPERAGGRAPRGGGTRRPARNGRVPRARQSPPGRGAAPAGQTRPAAADEVPVDAVAPAPAESRTGVCRSYFISHECWRVPSAYCNVALQVCVIRRCPVYQLHKDALERRFAKKFKHLW